VKLDSSRFRPQKSEVERLLSDNRLAKDKLGWVPQIALRDGLSKTIEWISTNLSHYRLGIYQV